MSELLVINGWDDIAYYLSETVEGRDLLPEEKLLLAVIIQAVDDATNPNASSTIQSAARSVIFSSSATELKGMCHLLNIDYSVFRAGVKRMIDKVETLRR
jgi:hypothetical protein